MAFDPSEGDRRTTGALANRNGSLRIWWEPTTSPSDLAGERARIAYLTRLVTDVEVPGQKLFVLIELTWIKLGPHSSVAHDVHGVGYRRDGVERLLDQDHSHPRRAQPPDVLEDHVDVDRAKPLRRLIQQDHVRL